jgi:Ca2+-binding RTX toxin-like protein
MTVLDAAKGTGVKPVDFDAVVTAVVNLNTAIAAVNTSSAAPGALASIVRLQGVAQAVLLPEIGDTSTVLNASKYDADDIAALAAALPVSVFVVAPSGGSHTSLSAAINAAAPGDLITVRADYAEANASVPILVTKNNLRIMLEGTGAALSFKLDEEIASGVLNLTLSGTRNANVTGNAASNLIIGNDGVNWIDGLAGNDKISGRGGDDDLYGSAGNDFIDGGMGWDNVFGGSGNDRLLSGEGGATAGSRSADVLSGGSGNDILIVTTQDASAVQLLGGSGNDLYRFASIEDGRDDSGNARNVATDPRPLSIKSFIADLSNDDAIDMGALVRGATGNTPVGTLVAGVVQSGDLPFEFGSGKANSGLKVIGLTAAATEGGVPTFSASTGLRDDVQGSLKVALASSTEVNAAITRGADPNYYAAAQFESINSLLVQFSPMYQTV